ncbi:MAG: 2'-5' RNA ligase family protein [Nocardioidaceae bacterium]
MATLGVAIAVPDPFGTELRQFRASFGDPQAAGVPTHVTLLPPTEIDDDDLAVVEQHLEQVAAEHTAFGMHLRGTATFRPVSPVVFVAVAEGISESEMLASSVRTGPLKRELSYPFHPHVTVAHGLDEVALDSAFETLSGYECEFDVAFFTLYLHTAGDGWVEHRHFGLGGDAGA